MELLPIEPELDLAIGHPALAVGRLRFSLPGAPVPDDDVAGPVLRLWDHALEVEVLDRVVLNVDRHPPCGRVQRRAARDGPRHEHAAHLQTEVVVEARGPMALDDEPT